MNLTKEESAKVIKALEDALIVAPGAVGRGDLSREQRTWSDVRAALAIVNAAQDRPQPAVDALIEAGNAMYDVIYLYTGEGVGGPHVDATNKWQAAKYAAADIKPLKHDDPYVMELNDALAPMAKLMDEAKQFLAEHAAKSAAPVAAPQYSARDLVPLVCALVAGTAMPSTGDSSDSSHQEAIHVKRLKHWLEHHDSAAPVAEPKVLTDDMIKRVSHELYLDTYKLDDHEWQRRLSDAFADGLRYARDNSYLAPANMEKLIEAGDAMRHWGERLCEYAEKAMRGTHARRTEVDDAIISFGKRVKTWDAIKSDALVAEPAVNGLIEAGDAMRRMMDGRPIGQEHVDASKAWDAAKSAAPVASAKVLTNEEIEGISMFLYGPALRTIVTENGAHDTLDVNLPERFACRRALRYVRDNGYLSPSHGG